MAATIKVSGVGSVPDALESLFTASYVTKNNEANFQMRKFGIGVSFKCVSLLPFGALPTTADNKPE